MVDWHSLTTDYANPGDVRENVIEVATDWLAAGLDPARSTIFIQSLVPQHAELHLLLSMITPVLVARARADLQGAAAEPRGARTSRPTASSATRCCRPPTSSSTRRTRCRWARTRRPHIELAREIVRRFNNLYGEVFPEPQTLLTEAKRIPGTDGRKMSKSYGNAIYLKDDPETVSQKLRPMVTDPARKRRTDPGDPDICPVFDLHKRVLARGDARRGPRTAAAPPASAASTARRSSPSTCSRSWREVHARRPELAARPDTVWDILVEGSKRARAVAEATMEEVRAAMKIRYDRP